MSDKPAIHNEAVKRAWEKQNLEHFHYFRRLNLYTKLETVEGMANTIRRFQTLRNQRTLLKSTENEKR